MDLFLYNLAVKNCQKVKCIWSGVLYIKPKLAIKETAESCTYDKIGT